MVIEQSPLLNSGIVFLNEKLLPHSGGTFVVLGAPRGGTSMVAGALHHLGLFMGQPLSQGSYEDATLITAISRQNLGTVKKTIAARNREHAVWGWKQPAQVDYFVA